MTVYSKGQPGELPEILDFINMVFSMHRLPHDFRALLPKLYGAQQASERYHYLAKEEGKIRAVVCALPITLRCGERSITCAAVGSVSVHPYSRGKGYMKQLMAMATEDMEKNHITLSVLDGRRHRYQYYGYEPAGHSLEYQFIADDFRHCASRYPDVPVSLVKVECGDTGRIAALTRMYSEEPVRTDRPEQEFYDICSSWESVLYAVETAEGTAGYLCGRGSCIHELILTDESLAFSVLKAYLSLQGCDRLTLSVSPCDSARIRSISGFCERWGVKEDDNYRIFDYCEAIRFFLAIKAEREALTDGCLTLAIGGGTPLRITVSAGNAVVSACSGEPDLQMSEIEALDLLFSPASFYGKKPDSPLSSVNWFPLPLFVPHLDKC